MSLATAREHGDAGPELRGGTLVGTEMDVRLTDSLDSGKAMVEDWFEGTTVND